MARGSGDIVYEIGGTADSLIAAATSGGKSLRAMERDAKALQTQIDRMGKVQADYQRALNQTIGVQDRVAKSAKASAQVFREWESASKQVNALRASIDPLYAASQRYEQALETLDAAVQNGIISQAEHTRMVDLAGKAFLTAGGQASQSASQIGGFAGVMSRNRAAVQMFGYNIQDVAVQLAAGTRATTVFAQQGSQMLGVLGPYGAIAGAALAVTLPLAGAFFSAGEGATSFKDAVSGLEEAVRLVDEATKNYTAHGLEELKQKYGEIDQSVLNLIEHERQFAIARADASAAEAVAALANEYGALAINLEAVGLAAKSPQIAIQNMARDLGLTTDQTRDLVRALQDANNAKDHLARAEALSRVVTLMLQSTKSADDLTGGIVKAEAEMRRLATSVPGAGWLAGMIGQAETLAEKLWDGVRARAALAGETATDAAGNATSFEPGSRARSRPARAPSGEGGVDWGVSDTSGGGSGGGGGTDKLEALKQSLMSEAEVEMAAYAERQAMLEQSLEAKRLTLEEYNRLYEQMQSDHQAKMTEIDVWRYGDGLAKAEAFFGDMASAMQGGNDAMVRIARAFGAIEALINAWRAYNQVLANPSLPWFAKLPKAAAVLAAGMGAVNAIKGGGSSAKSSASTGAATDAAQSPATVNIQWTGAMTADSMGSLTKKLNAEYKQGYRLNFVAA